MPSDLAENLRERGLDVTVVQFGNQILAPIDVEMAAIAQNHLRSKGVTLKFGLGVTVVIICF